MTVLIGLGSIPKGAKDSVPTTDAPRGLFTSMKRAETLYTQPGESGSITSGFLGDGRGHGRSSFTSGGGPRPKRGPLGGRRSSRHFGADLPCGVAGELGRAHQVHAIEGLAFPGSVLPLPALDDGFGFSKQLAGGP